MICGASSPLAEIVHLIIDATYIKVRIGGSVRDCALFTAIGVRRENGQRMVWGLSVALSEAEVHWCEFLVSLKERGIGIPDTVISNAILIEISEEWETSKAYISTRN